CCTKPTVHARLNPPSPRVCLGNVNRQPSSSRTSATGHTSLRACHNRQRAIVIAATALDGTTRIQWLHRLLAMQPVSVAGFDRVTPDNWDGYRCPRLRETRE